MKSHTPRGRAQSTYVATTSAVLLTSSGGLLHATPVSLTTNQKLLEPEEMHLFLEYIYVSILDIVDLAKQMLGEPTGDPAVH